MYQTEKLKKLRKKNKYTMKYMSSRLNISETYYCMIENKGKRLNYDTAIKIARIFNLKPDDIFFKNSHK